MRSHAFDGSKTPAASSPDACFPATAGRMRSMESRRGRRPNAVIAFAHEGKPAGPPAALFLSSFPGSRPDACVQRVATAADRYLRIAFDATLQATSVIAVPAAVAWFRQPRPPHRGDRFRRRAFVRRDEGA